MLALYKILILDIDDESKSLVELKKLIYQLSYMDNCAIAFDSSAELEWAYKQVKGIFEPYHFRLQQFITNDSNLQEIIDSENEVKTDRNVKLLGLVWDREKDCLSTKPINLDIKANTKREVLRTIASQYDLYNFNGPLLNRSRLFLHRLQCDQHLSWDQALDKERSREWQNIAKQANAAPVIKVPRFAGSRDDTYKLIAYSDSSKCIFGVVIYIQCISTGKLSFAFAKNRMVGKNLQSKSMPSLELQSIALAVECLLDLYKELSGPSCIKPIKIQELRVYSDSLVALSWIYSHTHNLDKLQKCSVFVKNRLHEISELCLKHPVIFSFVSGEENPGDCITRCLSYKSLMKTNYLTGPDLVNAPRMEHSKDTLEFVVPDPKMDIQIPVNSLGAYISSKDIEIEHFQMTSRVSSFHRLILIYRNVLLFVNKLKIKVMARDPDKFNHLKAFRSDHNFFAEASRLLLSRDQGCYFAEELEYFNSSERLLKDVPRIVGQLNIYIDREGLLRVRSKLSRLKDEGRYRFPILLSKDSTLTTLIIRDYHERFAHAGVYSVLSEMRKMFWMSKSYSTVKKVLKSCVLCRRFNERAIKLNQNSYRDFRINAPEIPFRYIFMDYMGPYFVHINSQKVKVWLLCITCNWSRAINLKLCYDLSVKEFLRAFQLHCFEFGLPELCISDMGTQLVAGANIIMDFLRDPEVKLYLEENGVKPIQFEHFFKGQSQLGSMVETCVKMTKKLVYGSIKNNVLKVRDFEFLIAQTVHLVNRRPIAFKEALRGENLDASVPQPITPESLIRGYDLTSVNIIPDLQRIPEIADDPTYTLNKSSKIKNCFSHLRKVRNNLVDLYHSEFLATLTQQVVDKKNRYLPVKHTSLQKNDIVLIKELYCKPNQYPMGLVKVVTVNDIGEVTGAVVLKGKTREITKRHVSNLLFLLSPENQIKQDSVAEKPIDDNLQGQTRRACKPRVAAERFWCRAGLESLFVFDGYIYCISTRVALLEYVGSLLSGYSSLPDGKSQTEQVPRTDNVCPAVPTRSVKGENEPLVKYQPKSNPSGNFVNRNFAKTDNAHLSRTITRGLGSSRTCYWCNKTGHIQANCFARQSYLQRQATSPIALVNQVKASQQSVENEENGNKEAFPLRKVTSKAVLEKLVEYFCRYGLPCTIQSDCGNNFTCKYFRDRCAELAIQHITSVPYLPENQGVVERFHQTLKSIIEKAKVVEKEVQYMLDHDLIQPSSSPGSSPIVLAGLAVNIDKCEFVKAVVTYLGHEAGLGKVAPKHANIEVIANLPQPLWCRAGLESLFVFDGYIYCISTRVALLEYVGSLLSEYVPFFEDIVPRQGRKYISIEAFLTSVEAATKERAWSERKRIVFAKQRIRGKASRRVKRDIEFMEPRSWQHLKQHLRQRLGLGTASLHQYICNYVPVREEGEDCFEFFDRISEDLDDLGKGDGKRTGFGGRHGGRTPDGRTTSTFVDIVEKPPGRTEETVDTRSKTKKPEPEDGAVF
ncbi:uncharacterized protein [Palaemon carinicauda]|uniref:uncharacterized protein n=1 Tax=Palaemon carinicauda TaxID=392227 RepID=UPI0035B6751B